MCKFSYISFIILLIIPNLIIIIMEISLLITLLIILDKKFLCFKIKNKALISNNLEKNETVDLVYIENKLTHYDQTHIPYLNSTCPDFTYPEKDKCWNCLCLSGLKCLKDTKICDCSQKPFFSGNYCQIHHPDDQYKRLIIDKPSNPILTEKSFFTFRMLTFNYLVHWDISFTKEKCINSLSEDVLVVRKGCFQNNKKNYINLTVIDQFSKQNYTNSITIQINNTDYKNDVHYTISYPSETEDIIPMETIISILFTRKATNQIDKLQYSLSYIDKYGDELSITPFNDNTLIETPLPFLTQINIFVKNDRGETNLLGEAKIQTMSTKGYDISINNILEEKISNNTKIKKLMNYCMFGKILFSREQLGVVEAIIESVSKEINIDKNSSTIQSLNTNEHIDINYLFAFINHIMYFHNDQTKTKSDCNLECSLYSIEEVILKLVVRIKNASFKIEIESIKLIIRDLDTLLRFETSQYAINTFHQKLKEILNHLREITSKKLFKGEQLHFIGQRVAMFFDRPGNHQIDLSIPLVDFINQTDKLSDYIVTYEEKTSNCTMNDTLVCIKSVQYNNIKQELEYLFNVLMKESVIGVIVLKIEKEEIEPKYYSATNNQVNINIYSLIRGSIELKSLQYGLSFPAKTHEMIQTAEKRSPISCMSNLTISSLSSLSPEIMCQTFFNDSRVLCRCNTTDYITVGSNQQYADNSKEIQFKLPKVKYLNIIYIPLLYSSAFIVIISSIVLLFYDIYQDKKNYNLRELSEFELRQFIFKEINHLKSANVFLFALSMTYYQYPFVDVFSKYSHQNPRIIRFFKEIVIMLLSLFLCLLPFYFSDFTAKKAFTDNRDYKDINIKVDSLNVEFRDINRIFWISFTVSLLVRFCSYISFSTVTNHAHMKQLIWNPIKRKFKEYIYNDVKRDILLNDNWKIIKMRIFCINSLCGKHIIRNKNDKARKYLVYKRENEIQSETINQMPYIHHKLNKDNIISERLSNSSFEIDSQNLCKRSNKSIEVFPLFPLRDRIKGDNHSERITNKCLNKKDQKLVYQIQIKYSFTLSKNQQNVITQHTAWRFKNIARNYIYQQHQPLNMTVDTFKGSILSHNEIYFIDKQGCYSYYSGNQKEKVDPLIHSKKTLKKTAIAFGVLTLIFICIFGLVCLILQKAFSEYRYYLIKAWLLPCLAQIILFGLIMHYLMTLVATLLIFKFRQQRKKSKFIGLLYRLFVEKYMIDMFKLRNIMAKYHKEFEEEK